MLRQSKDFDIYGKNSVNLPRDYKVALFMSLSAMFTLAGYEFIRSASTVLFKTAYGADKLPLVMAAMPVVVFLGVWLYSYLLNVLGPRRTLLVTSLGSGLLILACYLVLLTGAKWITPILFLLKEFYIVLLIEQYWSYINSSVSPSSAKKINGPVTGIAGLGGAIGGNLVGVTAAQYGTETMILLAAFACIPAALVSNLGYSLFGEPEQPVATTTKRSTMGWHLFKENPTLAYLLAIVLSSQLVAAVLDYKFQGLLSMQFKGDADAETAFQGWFFGTLNTSVLVLQFIVTPLALNFVGLRWVHILMPMIHFAAITAALIEPNVMTVGLAFFLFKAFDYSIFRAAKEILYVPLSFDERYRAKEIIDVFGYRTGKGASSVVIVGLQNAGVLMANYYLAIALAATGLWLALIFPLTRRAKATNDSSDSSEN
ncbi:MAG: AAA family ATP:ADP antiporter [Cyclobacteriaceae bacterium]